jgi:hypothetical protein
VDATVSTLSSVTRNPSERPLGLAARIALALVLVIGLALATADPFTLVFYVSYATVGMLLAVRRPRMPMGWLMIAIAFGFIGTTTPRGLDVPALQAGDAPLGQFLWACLGAWSGYATFTGLIALAITFPDGRLPANRWRRPAAAAIGAGVALAAINAAAPVLSVNPDGGAASVLIPNRFSVLPGLPLWSLVPFDVLMLPMAVILVGGVVSMIVRYRRSSGLERLQLRWLVAAVTVVVLGLLAGLATAALASVAGGDLGGLQWLGTIVGFPMVPAAIAVAVLRYRLYEIDRIISRTIAYTTVTAILGIAFVAIVLGLQAVMAGVTQGETVPVAISTLAVFALFQPVRKRVRSRVDRRFNRARYDAMRVADRFAEGLRDEVDLSRLCEAVLGTVTETLAPARSAVWLRGPVAEAAAASSSTRSAPG